MNEEILQAMFDASQQQNKESKFTPEEASRFKKAFSDPEFRKMFSEYMDELQDPAHREETEAYISQLEGEQKVPEGKELIRPMPGFVAKTHKLPEKGSNAQKEKIFINVVQSDKIAAPSKTSTSKGDCWSVPYSVGPPHMEKDKKGDNAPCFDCCFHPEAIRIGERNKDFMNLLVTTAMDGIEEAYKRQEQKVKLDRDFHIVKGIAYKQGLVPTMMIASANKETWNQKKIETKTQAKASKEAAAAPQSTDKTSSSVKVKKADPTASSPEEEKVTSAAPISPVESAEDANKKTQSKKTTVPAIKKGFLNSSKSSLYPEKIPTIRPKGNDTLSEESRKAEENAIQNDSVKHLIDQMEKTSLEGGNLPTPPPKDAIGDAMKAVSTKVKAKPVVPPSTEAEPINDDKDENGPVAPEVICKHRDALSLGDFEGMKSQKVADTRPLELIYEIQLPKVTAPSKIVLDVSEKKLCLTYLDVYKLDMALPYAVHDKKGKAAYDKGKKFLKVTLPVQAAAPQSVVGDIKPASSSLVSEVNEDEAASSPTKQQKEPKKKAEVSHDRWVKKETPEKRVTELSDTGNPEEEELDESKKLFLEVQRQAELAKKKLAEQQEQLKALNSQPSPKKEVAATSPKRQEPTPKPVESEAQVDPNAPAFIECGSFMGRKVGYVFKRGDSGLGYYLDQKSSATATTTQDSNNKTEPKLSTTAEASQQPNQSGHKTKVTSTRGAAASKATTKITTTTTIQYHTCKYDIQQNKDTIAILFQIANIIPKSVEIKAEAYSLTATFEIVESDGGKKQYGLQFQLDRSICIDGFDTTQYKHDISSNNMALVVVKKNREHLWESDDGSDDWISSQVVPSRDIVVETEVETATSSEVEATTSSSPSKTATSATTTSTTKASTANTVKSIMSTMKFSTDFISELD